MNITILANRDLASNYAINLLLAGLAEHSLTIFLSAKVGGGKRKPPELKSLSFFEQGLFNQLLGPLLDEREAFNPSGSSPNQAGVLRCQTFAQLGQHTAQPIVELNQINTPQGLEQITASRPELIISIRFGVILQPQVINLPKYGVLNLHSGILPHYRGVMATFWAMLNGEKQLGTTLHYISDTGIDTGEVVATTTLAVDQQSCYLSHVLQLYVQGCQQILQAVSTLAKGQAMVSRPQPQGGNYYSFPDAEDLNAFKQQGLSLVNEAHLTDFLRKHYC